MCNRILYGLSGSYKTDFNLNSIIATLSHYFFPVKKKNSPANVIKVLATILNLVSFSLFDRFESDKLEKMNIWLLSGWLLSMNIA